MATNVSWNGVSYSVPSAGEENWGSELSSLIISLANNGLQKSGGNFTLTNDVDFGGTAGLKVSYLKSRTTNIATTGEIRLGNTETLVWRNAANSANLPLTVDSSNRLAFNSNLILSVPSTLTSSRVLVSDGSGVVSASSVTSTTLGYLDPTSSIQTQLDSKLALAGGTVAGNLTVTGLFTAVAPTASPLLIKSLSGNSQGLKIYSNTATDAASIINHYAADLELGTNNTVYQTFSSAGAITLGASGGSQTHVVNGKMQVTSQDNLPLSLTGNSSAGTVRFVNPSSSSKYNWLVGGQYNVNQGFEITPSTAVDGSTFSSPLFQIEQAGNLTLGSASNAANHRINGQLGINADATTTNVLNIRKDQNGATRFILSNNNTGSSAYSRISVTSDAGDFNIDANSVASGGAAEIGTDSTFTGGLNIKSGGNTPIRLKTNSTDRVTISGTGQVAISGLNYPTADGTNGQVLKTNGSGTLSFGTAATTLAVSAKTANYTVLSTDDVITCDTTGGAFTLTLPAAASNTGKVFDFVKTDASANGLTIDGNASETVGGSTTQVMYGQYSALKIVSDGTNWQILQWRKPSVSFNVHRNGTAQSIPNVTFTKVQFTHEEFDIGGYFDSSTNYRFTPLVPGKYQLNFFCNFDSMVDTAEVIAAIYKNGSLHSRVESHASSSKRCGSNVSIVVDANGTSDYFEAYIYQDTGGSLNVEGYQYFTCFSGFLIP